MPILLAILMTKAVYYFLMLVLWILAIIGGSALVITLFEAHEHRKLNKKK